MKKLKAIGKTILDIVAIIGAIALWVVMMLMFPIFMGVIVVAVIVICVIALIVYGIRELYKGYLEND